MSVGLLVLFTGVVMTAYVIPGPDWAVVLRHSARDRRTGFVAMLGVQAGLCVHLTAAALGVSTLITHSPVAFTALKVVGAAYLVYLGATALWRSCRCPEADPTEDDSTAFSSKGRIFRQAFTANVLNPKAALFFVSVLPQFLSADAPAGPQVLLLGGLDIALGLLWWTAFVLLTSRLSKFMRRSGPRKALDRVTGGALVGLGVTLATAG